MKTKLSSFGTFSPSWFSCDRVVLKSCSLRNIKECLCPIPDGNNLKPIWRKSRIIFLEDDLLFEAGRLVNSVMNENDVPISDLGFVVSEIDNTRRIIAIDDLETPLSFV